MASQFCGTTTGTDGISPYCYEHLQDEIDMEKVRSEVSQLQSSLDKTELELNVSLEKIASGKCVYVLFL